MKKLYIIISSCLIILIILLISIKTLFKVSYNYNLNYNHIKHNNINVILKFKNKINNFIEEINNINFEDVKVKSLEKDKLLIKKEFLENQYNKYNSNLLLEDIYKYNKIERNTIIYTIDSYNIDIKKVKKYLNNICNNINFIDFLLDNTNNYRIVNNDIYYKKDDFYKKFRSFSSDFKLIKEAEYEQFKKIPILMYHGILDSPWGVASLFVTKNQFESDMEYLKKNGYTSIFLKDINTAYMYNKPIIITFDDGYKDVYTNGLPLLTKYNMKATFFLISEWLDGKTYVNENMVKDMIDSGFIEIGSHTLSHAILGSLNSKAIEEEVKKSKENLEKRFKVKISSIAYPTGSYTDEVIKISSNYYDYGVTTKVGFEDATNYIHNKLELKRIAVYRDHYLKELLK